MFSWLHKEGSLNEEEMARTFNCGLGAVLVVAPQDAETVLRQLQVHEEAWIVGSVARKQPGETKLRFPLMKLGVKQNKLTAFLCAQVQKLWWFEI